MALGYLAKVLEMTLNGYSIEDMRNILINDYDCLGIDIKTVWLWHLKLITAMAICLCQS